MRPTGEIRTAIFAALREQGPMPLAEIVRQVPLQTTRRAVMFTVKNSMRAGQLEKVGVERRAHCKKWVAVYDLAQPACVADGDEGGAPAIEQGYVVLSGALGAWR